MYWIVQFMIIKLLQSYFYSLLIGVIRHSLGCTVETHTQKTQNDCQKEIKTAIRCGHMVLRK